LITADHGNAEINVDENGKPHTAHTLSPVPFIIFAQDKYTCHDGTLADLAPTVLQLLQLEKPKVMKGISLI